MSEEEKKCPLCYNAFKDDDEHCKVDDYDCHEHCVTNAIEKVRKLNDMNNEEKVAKMIEDLSRIVNGGGYHKERLAKAMAKQFLREHNTLQQLMLGTIQKFIVEITELEYLPVDARNEASIKWCKEVAKLDARFPFI